VLTVQQAIKDGSYLPLEKLFFVPRDGFHSFEYAHAWSFVYFLNNSKPEYEKGFKKFFKDFYTIAKGVEFNLDAGGGKTVPPRKCAGSCSTGWASRTSAGWRRSGRPSSAPSPSTPRARASCAGCRRSTRASSTR
jgi:hypothetical protein